MVRKGGDPHHAQAATVAAAPGAHLVAPRSGAAGDHPTREALAATAGHGVTAATGDEAEAAVPTSTPVGLTAAAPTAAPHRGRGRGRGLDPNPDIATSPRQTAPILCLRSRPRSRLPRPILTFRRAHLPRTSLLRLLRPSATRASGLRLRLLHPWRASAARTTGFPRTQA